MVQTELNRTYSSIQDESQHRFIKQSLEICKNFKRDARICNGNPVEQHLSVTNKLPPGTNKRFHSLESQYQQTNNSKCVQFQSNRTSHTLQQLSLHFHPTTTPIVQTWLCCYPIDYAQYQYSQLYYQEISFK